MIPRLYIPELLRSGQQCTLPPEVSKHLCKVLRARIDDTLILFNGDGMNYLATLSEPHHQHAQVQIIDQHLNSSESSLSIHLGQAILSRQKMDLVLQKSTELGVTHITPLHSLASDHQPKADRYATQHARAKAIIIAACEQSGRSVLPALNQSTDLFNWANNLSSHTLKLICDPAIAAPLNRPEDSPSSIAIAIGPESGWHDQERTVLTAAGFIPISFGPRVMRTETAALAIIASLQTLWGDFLTR